MMVDRKKDLIQQRALLKLKETNRGTCNISMGVGKTLIGIKHMAEQPEHSIFMVVAPNTSIFESWKEQCVTFGYSHLLKQIHFVTYISLTKDKTLELLKTVTCLYLDECHSIKESHDIALSSYTGSIVGLTGTPPRDPQSERGKMISKYCPIIYSYDTTSAIDDALLNDFEIVVHMLPLSTQKNILKSFKTKSFYTSEQSDYQYYTTRIEENPYGTTKSLQMARISRMRSLQNFKTKEIFAKHLLSTIDEKCIVFANSTDQAERICSNSYHSKNTKEHNNNMLQKFNDGDITCLSAVEQLNMGINIKNLKHGIILHSYANERQFKQKLGRLLRLSADEIAVVHVLCYKNTVDQTWVKEALDEIPQIKISYKNYEARNY